MGIRTKLLIAISTTVLISYIVLGFSNLKNMYEISFDALKMQTTKSSNSSSKYINDYLDSKKMIIETVSQQLEEMDPNELREDVRNMLITGKNSGGFGSVYIGYQNSGLMVRWSGRDTTPEKDNYDPRSRPWYKSAYSSKTSGITKPYVDSATKKLTISIFSPVVKNGQVVAVVGSDIFLDTIVSTVLNIDTNNLGLAYLVDKDGKTLIHKDKKQTNQKSKTFSQISDLRSGFADIVVDGENRLISFSKVALVDWYLFIDIDKDKAFASVDQQLIIFAVISLVFLIITIAIVFITLNKTLAPIQSVQDGIISFFEYLKGNSSTAKKLDVNSDDELGVMAQEINKGIESVQRTLDDDKRVIENVTNVVNEIKAGILTKKVTSTTSNKAVQELVDVLNSMIENLQDTIKHSLGVLTQYQNNNYVEKTNISCSGEIKELMDGINKLGETISTMLVDNKENGLILEKSSNLLVSNVNELSQNSTQAAASIEEIAASLDEVTSTIVSNNENVVQMAQYANALTTSANAGESLAKETTVAMNSIDEQVGAINDAITVIDQIAFQTNILSLNAAVEAATAGEAGKGFAVVAAEVRNLAGRSSEAAKEIKDLVEAATAKANEGKNISDKMIEGYNQLNENISNTSDLIKSVETASKEQQTGIVQINESISILDKQTQKNAIIATQTNEVAQKTDNIAKVVLSNVDEKEFLGKNNITIKEEVIAPKTQTRVQQKSSTSKKHTPISLNVKQDDEWESF